MLSFEQSNSPASSGGDTLCFTPEQQTESLYHRQMITPYDVSVKYHGPDVEELLAELAQLKEERRADATRDLHLRAQLAATTHAAAERERDLTNKLETLEMQLSQRAQVENFKQLVTSWNGLDQNATTARQPFNIEGDDMYKRIEALSRDVAEAQKRAESAEAVAKDMRWKLHDQGIQFDNLKRETVLLKRQAENVSKREQDLQQELATIRTEAQRVPALEGYLGIWKARAELNDIRVRQLAAEAASSRLQAERIAELEMALKQRSSQAGVAEARVRELESENEALRQDVNLAAAHISELNAAESYVVQLKAENRTLLSRAESAEAMLRSYHGVVLQRSQDMRGELEVLRARAQQIPALEATVAHLRSQVERFVEMEAAFVQLRAQAQQADEHARQVESDNIALRARQSQAESTRAALVSRAEAAEQRSTHLAADTEQLRARAHAAEASLAEAVERLNVMEGYLRRCDERASKLGDEVLGLRAALTEARKETATSAETERLRAERDSLLSGMRELLPSTAGSEYSDASEVLRAVENEFERMRERASAIEQRLLDLGERLEARGKSYTILKTRLAEVERNVWKF
ncbi:unnamed protein product [Peniophora sp. CBMAI 1063]|nr:unnamed protein product [Peniophora sp. CBMAI 1063]